jgi:hypothetical protein
LAAASEQFAEMDRMAAQLEQGRIEAARLEQELRVRETLLADAQSREERNRVEQAEPPKDEPVAPGRGHGTVLT